MSKTYVFRPGAHVQGDPQAVGEALDALLRENGQRLTPRIVVDAARPADSPLHPCFEWDDVRAAELFRETQARHVIASVRVVVQEGAQPRAQRAFVNVVETVGVDEQRGYVPIARVLSDAELFRQVCDQAARDLRAFEDRYAEFDALAGVGRAARAQIESLFPAGVEVGDGRGV